MPDCPTPDRITATAAGHKIDQLDCRLHKQATAVVDELKGELDRERAAAAILGHDSVAMMGQLMGEISDIDSRIRRVFRWVAANVHCWWCGAAERALMHHRHHHHHHFMRPEAGRVFPRRVGQIETSVWQERSSKGLTPDSSTALKRTRWR